jgi:hypothetical protein
MSDLIKSITTISVNDVLQEAFETAVEVTPTINDVILSYNPDSKVIGKSAFPAGVTTIANEAKTQADAANIATQQLSIDLAPSKIHSVPNTDRSITFTDQKEIADYYEINQDFTPPIITAGAKSLCGTVFHVLQHGNAKVMLPGFTQIGEPLPDQPDKLNIYLTQWLFGVPVYIRTTNSADYPANDGEVPPIVVPEYSVIYDKVFTDLDGVNVGGQSGSAGDFGGSLRIGGSGTSGLNGVDIPNVLPDIEDGDVFKITFDQAGFATSADVTLGLGDNNYFFSQNELINNVIVKEVTITNAGVAPSISLTNYIDGGPPFNGTYFLLHHLLIEKRL